MNNSADTLPIVSSDQPVTIIGGAEVRPEDLSVALKCAPKVVAADGGANGLAALGVEPVAVIGDLDSLTEAARARFADRLHLIEEQETVDFDKALQHTAAPLVVALGVTGGRLDHQLAALNVLARHPHRACAILGGGSVICLCPPRIEIDLAPGADLSLFPLAEVRIRSEGLDWPTDHLIFRPDGRVGTSNRASGRAVLRADRPGMLLILPDSAAAPLFTALLAPGAARWPARAG